jgi:hypothetical protein
LRDDFLHGLEHASFFGTGLLIWFAVLRAGRMARTAPAGALAAFATLLHSGLLGGLLSLAPEPLYPAYGFPPDLVGPRPARRPAARRPHHVGADRPGLSRRDALAGLGGRQPKRGTAGDAAMKTRLVHSAHGKRTYVPVLDTGLDPIACLTGFSREERLGTTDLEPNPQVSSFAASSTSPAWPGTFTLRQMR